MSEEMNTKGEIKKLRVAIDMTIETALMLRTWSPQDQPIPNSPKSFVREMSLVITKLQEAKMWAGKCLEQIGSELPKEFQDKAE